jgi:exosortase/archaeosortase family protein
VSEALGARDPAPVVARNSLADVVRPVVIFASAYVVGEWLLTLFGAAGALQSLSLATAAVTNTLAQLTGVPSTLNGIDVVLPERILRVSLECTGAYVFVAYAALVLAQPVRWSVRAVGLLVGLPVLVALNILRLVVVAHIAYRAPVNFDLLHDFLFQGLMILSALLVWMAWMYVTDRRATKNPSAEKSPPPPTAA